MHDLWGYVINNKEWIFSGVGVFIISLLVGFALWLFRRKDPAGALQPLSQRQKGGAFSHNTQIGVIHRDREKSE